MLTQGTPLTVLGGGVLGSVPFIGAAGVAIQDNATFFWDNVNKRLGLGNNAPTTTLDVTGGMAISGGVVYGGATTATAFIPTGAAVPVNGMYLSAANTLAWATNSAVKMTMSSTGALALPSTVGTGTYQLTLNPIGLTALGFIPNNTSALGYLIATTGADRLSLGTAATAQAQITTAGNILIGTTVETAGAGLIQLATGTTAAFGIVVGTDTNLYRAGAASWASNASLNLAGNIVVTGAGPNSIGGASNPDFQWFLTGTPTGQINNAIGLFIASTLNVPANGLGYALTLQPTINKAGAGTHADFTSLQIEVPIIGAGAATLTNASSLKIAGAPSVGTNQRALWVVAGASEFGGTVSVPGAATPILTTITTVTTGAGAQAGTLLNSPAAGNPTKWIPFNDAGVTRYIPAW